MRRSKGFTLIELLVVIGIIAVLAGFALPMIYRAYKNAQKAKVAADLGAIAMALEAYKGDFGDYPQVTVADTGFAVLGKALGSPYGDGTIPSSDPTKPDPDPNDPPTYDSTKNYKVGECVNESGMPKLFTADLNGGGSNWQRIDFSALDGLDGPGFRNRAAISGVAQGKQYPAYLQLGRVRMQGLAILDSADNPILYFSSASSKGSTTLPNSYACLPVAGSKPRWDLTQNLGFLRQAGETNADNTGAIRGFSSMLGDFNPTSETASTNCDGKIDPGEGPAVDKPFLLWSAGSDGQFGPARAVANQPGYPTKKMLTDCDDITNFR